MWERLASNTGGTVGGLASTLVGGQPYVYAATAVGVFRSLDSGRTWTLAGRYNTVPFAEAVVPSTRFEKDRTLFACASNGLYRSSDAGESWQPVLVGGRMLSIASAASQERERFVLLAGTEADGVLRSEDGGRNWTGANAGLLDLMALTISMSPAFASDRLGFAGTASGLYRTRNSARSWREVDTGLAEPAVQCVAVSPAFADDRLVLAGTEADGLLRSEDAGATWDRPASLIDEGVTSVAFSSRYTSTRVVAAAIESGVALSEDGGRTWRRSRGSPPGLVLSLLFVAAGEDEVLLAGLHEQGVARSLDLGASWDIANVGLNARLLTGLVVSHDFAHDRTLFTAGHQDGVSVSVDGGCTWAARNAGLGDAEVLGLVVSRDRTLYAATTGGIYVSRDGARQWEASPGATGPARAIAIGPGRSEAVSGTPAGDRARQVVVAALSGGALLASDDSARTWSRLAAVAEGAEVLLVALSPAFALDRTIFVATSQAAAGPPVEVVLWRSVDGGERWSRWLLEHELGIAQGQPFMAVAASPSYPSDEVIFVGLGARVFTPLRHAREVRAGQRRPVWRSANLGDGTIAITAIAPTPSYADDHTVFAATNAGVFVSRDAGETFQPWSDGLKPPGIVALAISPTYAEDRLVHALGLGGTIWRRHDPLVRSGGSGESRR